MRQRIIHMRSLFAQALTQKTRHNFSFLLRQKGLFSLLGLDPREVRTCREKFAIYMTDDGRVNLAGLTPQNMDQVVAAIVSILSMR